LTTTPSPNADRAASRRGNLFAGIPAELPAELFEPLLETAVVRVERIVSAGHVTPPDEWYDQDRDEWVVLVTGGARIRFEAPEEPAELRPGDYMFIPAHRRHRVEWTDPQAKTVWLALHLARR
jgi:cupin 2 domain-containing protein